MANTDYFNIGALDPSQQGGWKPSGAMAGLDYYNRMKQFYDFMDLKQQMMKMSAEKQKGELEDYQIARPSALESTIATNRAEAESVGRRKIGEANTTAARGQFDWDTLSSRINDTLESNDEKRRERGLKSIEHGLRTIDLVGPSIERGDYEMAEHLFNTAGSPEAKRIFNHIKNSENPTESLNKWRQTLEEATARSKTGEVKVKGGFDIKEREIMADAQKFTAYMHYLAAQFRTGDQKAKEKMEGLLARTVSAWFEEKDPQKKASLLEKVNTLFKMVLGVKAAGAPMSGAELGAGVLGGQTAPNAPGAPAARVEAYPPIPPLGQGQPPVPATGVTRQQVEAAGERYQPDIYDYEFQNGRLMKSRK